MFALRRRIAPLAVLCLAVASWATHAAEFVRGTDDLPVAPGLTQRPDDGLVFEVPQGRIVTAYLEGRVGMDDVIAFYTRTLPQLGWQPAGPGRFARAGEALMIEPLLPGPPTVIRLTVVPR